ncbi:MAG: TrkH family potassium uptake protein [Tissierellia bacterium]|nr:TrkH family potassium uptake protein [Tissierellia bacterium]
MNRFNEKLMKFTKNPSIFLLLGFLSVILIGTICLHNPYVTADGTKPTFLDALFTATSATCVTGLITQTTATYWNFKGQIIILFLIQIGGLGIMTVASMYSIIAGRRIGLKQRMLIKEQFNTNTFGGLVKIMKYAFVSTLFFETLGALMLMTRFIPEFGMKGIWYSIFHSISAFCNAGFDIFGNSLVDFRNDLVVNFTIMGLIIVGGLGFMVVNQLIVKRSIKKLNAHAKLALTITAILIVFGFFWIYIVESFNSFSFKHIPTSHRIIQSIFQSVTTRTAGFNTMDISTIRDTSAFLMIILMFIGGSPASTAGGLKTTTIGVLLSATISSIKGESQTVMFKRRVSDDTVKKALAMVITSLAIIFVIAFIMTISDDFKFIDILFETVSAYGTVGLSRGITAHLSHIGKILIIFTMYIGRVGPLTMAYAFGRNKTQSKLSYPQDNIMIG